MIRRFAVIGLGRFGTRLSTRLALAGQEVIAIDTHRDRVEQIRDRVTLAVAMDGTDEQALKMQGIDQVDVAVVGVGHNFEAGALAVSVLKQLGVPRVIGRAMTPTIGTILRRIGADDVVNPEQESADQWTTRLVGPEFLAQYRLDETHHLIEVTCPKAWQGQTLQELDLRRGMNLYVVGMRRQEQAAEEDEQREQTQEEPTKRRIQPPDPTDPLREDDILVVMGADADLAKLE